MSAKIHFPNFLRAVIPTIISQALAGDCIKLGSLSPIRDFTYVTDIAEGFIKIAESQRSVGEVINIGSGRGISIGETAELVGKIIGKKLKISEDSQRVRPENSEVIRLKADNSKAKKLLGWQPQMSLRQGLSRTIDFIKENQWFYNPSQYAV